MIAITSSYDWCNNDIGAKLNKEYPRDFSLCDIDGVVRTEYVSASCWHTRFIIYESKHPNEHLGESQLRTLTTLSASMNWKQFDDFSGIYLIKHDMELLKVRIYRVNNNDIQHIGNMSFDMFYAWISAKDKTT